jgi:DNA topoisomerase IA
MEITSDILEAAKGLGKNQKLIIKSLREDPLPFQPLTSTRKVIFNLKNRGIIEIQDEQMSLTVLGHAVLAYLDSSCPDSIESISDSEEDLQQINYKALNRSETLKKQKLEKSNQFLELYNNTLDRITALSRHKNA